MNKILGPDPAVMDAIGRGNKVVFLDIEMGEPGKGTPLGRIKLELFVKEVSAILTTNVILYNIPSLVRLTHPAHYSTHRINNTVGS